MIPSGSASCTARCEGISQHHGRHRATHQTVLRAAELHGYTQPLDRAYMRAFKNSIRNEVAKHFAEFFLEVESNFEPIWTPAHRCSDSCSHSCTQQHRTQTARNVKLLAGASPIGTRWSSVTFTQKQNFWRRENCFHEAQPRSLTRQMPRPKPPTVSQRRSCWSDSQTITAATARTRPLVSRNQHQRH